VEQAQEYQLALLVRVQWPMAPALVLARRREVPRMRAPNCRSPVHSPLPRPICRHWLRCSHHCQQAERRPLCSTSRRKMLQTKLTPILRHGLLLGLVERPRDTYFPGRQRN